MFTKWKQKHVAGIVPEEIEVSTIPVAMLAMKILKFLKFLKFLAFLALSLLPSPPPPFPPTPFPLPHAEALVSRITILQVL
jgi:hypothetical protein